MTKYKTRYDPPDIYEALDAAEGLTDDVAEQADIAASLIGVSVDDAKAAIEKRTEAAEARKARMSRLAAAAERGPATENGIPSSSARGAGAPNMSWLHGNQSTPRGSLRNDHGHGDQHGSAANDFGHPLDNRMPDHNRSGQNRRNHAQAPEVVVVRKTKSRSFAPHDTARGDRTETRGEAATRPSAPRKSSLGGKLRLNLNG